MQLNPNLELWKTAAVALCTFACNGDKGRGKDDPVYRDVTEGRDGPGPMQRKEYSSCADLGHWMLERLGLREKWLNRASLHQWRDELNVYELGLGCPIAHAAPTAADWTGPEAGDICEIWNGAKGQDAHVFVCLGPSNKVDGKLLTANYGAGGMSEALWPGARLSNSSFTHTEVGWFVGSRKLQRIIKLADYVPLITAQPDLTGAAIDGQAITDLGAAWAEDVP